MRDTRERRSWGTWFKGRHAPVEPEDEYSFLTFDQWLQVCDLLEKDISRDRSRGISLYAPSYPEAGQELIVGFDPSGVSGSGITWVGNGGQMLPLSSAILADACDDIDELQRSRDSLRNTAAVLDARIAELRAGGQ